MRNHDLTRQVAGMRALDDDGAEALAAAAITLLRTADDVEAWRLFAEALNTARPLATMATHPVWDELRPKPSVRLVMRANHPQGPQRRGPGMTNDPEE